MWAHVIAGLILLGHTLAFMLLGVFFLVRGLRGRRIGEEPRCKSCAYQLTGRLDAERCPECGCSLTPDTVVRGLRKRRWGLLLFGAVAVPTLWSFSSGPVWGLAYVNWYRHYPTSMILRDARADRIEGIAELERRLLARTLSHAQGRAVAELAVSKYLQPPCPPHRQVWEQLVAKADRRGFLTDGLRKQILSQMYHASLTPRPVIRQGDPVVLQITVQSPAIGFAGYRYRHDLLLLRVADQDVYTTTASLTPAYNTDAFPSQQPTALGETVVFAPTTLAAGTARVNYVGRHLFLPPKSLSQRTATAWSSDTAQDATIEVLPADAPDPVAWLTDDDVQLRSVIRVCLWTETSYVGFCLPRDDTALLQDPLILQRAGEYEIVGLEVRSNGPLPIPVAFDFALEVGGEELEAETIPRVFDYVLAAEGEGLDAKSILWPVSDESERRLPFASDRSRTLQWWGTVKVAPFTDDEVFIILRSSRDQARRTVHLFEIWQGDLRFGPFPVKHAEPENP